LKTCVFQDPTKSPTVAGSESALWPMPFGNRPIPFSVQHPSEHLRAADPRASLSQRWRRRSSVASVHRSGGRRLAPLPREPRTKVVPAVTRAARVPPTSFNGGSTSHGLTSGNVPRRPGRRPRRGSGCADGRHVRWPWIQRAGMSSFYPVADRRDLRRAIHLVCSSICIR